MENKRIIGVFDSEAQLVSAIGQVQENHIRINEIYTPYPVMKAIDAMGKRSIFTFAAFLYGLFSALAILAFLYYTSVVDWPLNFGGKPSSAFPSFIVITIVLTIFMVTILSLLTFSVRAKIWPGKAYVLPDARSTDDKFIMVIDRTEADKAEKPLETLLKDAGASEVYEKEVEEENVF
jgi:hypothetical protein